MQHIKSLLNKRVKENGIDKNVNISLIIEKFNQIIKSEFGDNIIKKLKPLYIKNRQLYVACLSSIVTQELVLNKQKIISSLNKEFPGTVIDDIKFNI